MWAERDLLIQGPDCAKGLKMGRAREKREQREVQNGQSVGSQGCGSGLVRKALENLAGSGTSGFII